MRPRVKPLGVGELNVVKLKYLGLVTGEPAHIETIMPFETRSREHRRLSRTEIVETDAFERTEEQTHELETTERFQIEQMAQEVQKADTQFEAGASLSASYGPVKIDANTRYSTGSSSEVTDRLATNYAKDVVERALEKVVEKVREERVTTILDEVEETNRHAFENNESESHSGLYFWVHKRYRAKRVKFGNRLMYEFVVHHPGAFYNFAQLKHLENADLPPEPEPPTELDGDEDLRPDHITRDSYMELVSLYAAEGVQPPPAEYFTVVRTIARELDPENHFAIAENDLELPEDYTLAGEGAWISVQGDDGWFWNFFIGTRSVSGSDGGNDTSVGGFLPTGATGIIPLAIQGHRISSLLLSVTLTGELRAEAFAQWQLRTYAAIIAAYTKKKQEFDEAVAAAQIQQGVQVEGENPERNRQVMMEELQKACITLWTGYHFPGLPVIDRDEDAEPPGNFPRINIENSEELAPEVTALTQFFDWGDMTVEWYPYFWAHQPDWLELYQQDDPDPLFALFKRGGAAKVIVPVNLAMTASVLYYQLTGKLRFGEDIPLFDPPDFEQDFTDEIDPDDDPPETELALYTAYMEELAAEAITNTIDEDVEISADDPETWLVEEPTSLVWLQPGSELPAPDEDA